MAPYAAQGPDISNNLAKFAHAIALRMILELIHEDYPWNLLLLADPDKAAISRYLGASDCFVARDEGVVVGVAVLRTVSENIVELMNIAVTPGLQQRGYGNRVLSLLIRRLRNDGCQKLEVGTGTFGYQLKFYQKLGFRVTAIRRDFFLDHYAEPVIEEGLQHKDMLVLSLDLSAVTG